MWWVPVAWADGWTPLPRAGEVPEARWYAEVDEGPDGRLAGRWRRRRDGEHELSVLADGLVVRWVHTTRAAVEDHARDAAGRPFTTLRAEAGAPVTVTLHGSTDAVIQVGGWAWVALPGGGAVWAPSGATAGGDAAGGPLLGGTWAAAEHPATDPFAPAFVEGLLDGCACALLDRTTGWIDGRPAARHALLVPPPGPPGGAPDLVDVWAVPRGDRLLVLTFRAAAPADVVAAAVTARALPALVDLDAAPPAGAVP